MNKFKLGEYRTMDSSGHPNDGHVFKVTDLVSEFTTAVAILWLNPETGRLRTSFLVNKNNTRPSTDIEILTAKLMGM